MPKAKKERANAQEKGGAAPPEQKRTGQKTRAAISEALPGDTVRVACAGAEYEGLLLPGNDKNNGVLPIKLPSGYNVGIKTESIKKIEVVLKAQPKPEKQTQSSDADASIRGKYTSILACGGTIASKIDYRSGAVFPATSPQELLDSFPFAKKMNTKPRMLFSLLSEDMSSSHWAKIAEAAADEIKGGAEGIVITHGTDTMHYTSAALSFMLQNLPCPVILTGSQRSSDRGSSDAEVNMHSSLLAAKSDLSGVYVCMHEGLSDDSCLLHFGTKARKMHTTRRDAFHSIGCLPAARVFPAKGQVQKISPRCAQRDPSKKPALDTKANPNVAMIYSYPGIKPDAFSRLSNYDGVVAIGTGIGHLPSNCRNDPLATSVIPAVKGLIDSGVAVVLVSQAIYGRVDMNVYAAGRALREIGVIGHLCDLTPEAAYAKLCWVLGHEKKPEKVRTLMETDMAGEITPRSEITEY